MRRYNRGVVIAVFATLATIGLVYAVETGAQFEWLGTVGGLRIGGVASDPGNHTLQFSGYNSYINFPYHAFVTTPAGNVAIESSGTGYMKSTVGNCWTQANSDGRALLKSKATGGLFALSEAHYDGSVYATSAANAAVAADVDGSAWMMGSGGGTVDTLATGDSRIVSSAGSKADATQDGNASIVSSTANAVIATNYGDVIIRIGGQPEGGGAFMMGGAASAKTVMAEDVAVVQDRAARIATIKDEVNNDEANQ
ncbi:MAG: hypothetical protein HYZ00_01840 [Candidatus Hydrogenedentes bacterium]|nr:hypothetical protein [Candidatus Hydrogenedentota bacterium]